MKLEMKETATEFLFFVNNEPAARIKKHVKSYFKWRILNK